MIHPSFTLDGKPYREKELALLCQGQLSDQALPGYEKELYGFLQQWLDETPVVKVRTSGSTACPKEITLEKRQMIASARLSGEFFGIKPGATALLCLPMRFIAGKMMVVRALSLGLRLITTIPKGNPVAGLDPELQIDFAAMVPAQAYTALEDPASSQFLKAIRLLILGGGEIPRNLEEQLWSFPHQVYATYGMTETITHVAARAIRETLPDSVYHALPHIRFRQDKRQCLLITAAHLGDGEVITNDIIELYSPTSFKFVGRYDNVINTGGIKIFPEQIEKKLEGKLPGKFYLTGVPDDRLGERMVLVIEEDKSIAIQLIDGILSACLDPGERPKEIIFVEEIRLTANGKIKRKKSLQA